MNTKTGTWFFEKNQQTELEPPPLPSGDRDPWVDPMPQVLYNKKDLTDKCTNHFHCIVEDPDRYYIKSPPYEKVNTLNIAPVFGTKRNIMWGQSGPPVFEDPSEYSTDKDAQNAVRIVFYDLDRDGFYFLEAKNPSGRKELETLLWQMKKDASEGKESFAYKYELVTYPKKTVAGATFYYLRLKRVNDKIHAKDPDKVILAFQTREEATAGIDYARSEVPAKVFNQIRDRLDVNSDEALAVKMLSLTGTSANYLLSRVRRGEMTREEMFNEAPRVRDRREE